MLRLPFLKHIVQVYIVARCGLNFVKVQLVNVVFNKVFKVFINVPSYLGNAFLAISDSWCYELSALKKEHGIEFYEKY